MNGDIFATKGLEYLIVIAYLAVMVWAVRWFASRQVTQAAASGARSRSRQSVPWFALADGFHYHPGHGWAAAADGDVVTVGMDDFAAQLVGAPDALELPAIGTAVRQGERGWTLVAGERALPMLSPVEGEVVEVNPAVLDAPRLAADDPYGAGWLLKVRPRNRQASLKNLLSGDLAAAWMRQTVERLRRMPAAELGVAMPDGGVPVRGFGRVLGPDEWSRAARDFFLAD